MLTLDTLRIIKSRDILWLNETYGEYKQRTNPLRDFTVPIIELDKAEDVESAKTENLNTGTLPRELRNLHTFYNPIMDTSAKDDEKVDEERIPMVMAPTPTSIDRGDIGSKVWEVEEAKPMEHDIAAVLLENQPKDVYKLIVTPEKEPATFDKAWHHLNPNKRAKWREAVRKEFHDMNSRNVWDVINKSEMPEKQTCIKSK